MRLESVGSAVYIEYVPPINYADCVTIETSRNGGDSWHPVPSLTLVPVSGDSPVGMYDYMAPLNSTSWYRAIPFRREDGVLFAAPKYSEWASVTPRVEDWRLK